MSKLSPIAAAQIITAPLSQLYLSDLNPRQEADPEGIALLAQSLVTCGLIQNLSGLRDGEGRIAIVAGGRRLRALQIAVTERPDLAEVSVNLAPDAATAQMWASTENAARLDLDPADEIRAYGKMDKAGASAATIAHAFAVTEAHVYRRLALAALPAPVLDALKAGKISLGHAKAFTLSQDEALTFEVLAQVQAGGMSEHTVKQRLQPGAVSHTDRRVRFVGQDAYTQAGGTLLRDLFEERMFYSDTAILDQLFAEKFAATVKEQREAEGWKWAETLDDTYIGWNQIEAGRYGRLYPVEEVLTEEQAEEYDALAELANNDVLDEEGQARLDALEALTKGSYTPEQITHSGCLYYVSNQGELCRTEGLVKPEDIPAAIEAGLLQPSRHPVQEQDDAPKSPYSNVLVQDMQALRLAAVQRECRRRAGAAPPAKHPRPELVSGLPTARPLIPKSFVVKDQLPCVRAGLFCETRGDAQASGSTAAQGRRRWGLAPSPSQPSPHEGADVPPAPSNSPTMRRGRRFPRPPSQTLPPLP